MTQAPQDRDLSTSLRAALLGSPSERPHLPAPRGHATTGRPAEATPPRVTGLPAAIVPTATELLEASPNIRRLCESYHTTHKLMVERSRRQRVGIALLVGALAITTFVLARQGRLNPVALNGIAFAIAGACIPALGIMALLWVRDDHRLRDAQGDRLLRALQFNCELAPERLRAFLQHAEPTLAFFDCYALWRTHNRDARTGLAKLLGTPPSRRTRSSAA